MTEADELSFHSWKAPGRDLEILSVEDALRGIRDFSIDGHMRLARGGIEVGGVLFGAHEGPRIWVQAWRPIACEHASGPSFILSEKDDASLTRMVDEYQADPALHGMLPVGWFVSHTRSGIEIRDHELKFWEKHFAESWQIALVVKPSRFQPVDAGYFFRDELNEVRQDASYQMFVLPVEKRGPPRDRRERGHAEVPEQAPAQHSQYDKSDQAFEQSTAPSTMALDKIQPGPLPPMVLREELRPSGTPRKAWAMILMIVAGALLGMIARIAALYYIDTHPPTLGLRVSEENQELRVRWDKDAVKDWSTASGEILFREAKKEVTEKMDSEALKLGAFGYVRHSTDVLVQLKVVRNGKPPIVEVARFVGPYTEGEIPGQAAGQGSDANRAKQQAQPRRKKRVLRNAPELDIEAPLPAR